MSTLTITGNLKKELANGTVLTIVDDDGAVTADIIATPGSIGTAELADDAVTNDKLDNIARGSVKVGGAADAPTDLDASTSGQILVGDGTDIASVAVSGDISLSSAGVTAVVAADLETATLTNIADTELLIGTGAGTANFAVMSGDATLSNAGALTIAANAVDNTKLAAMVAGTIKIGSAAGAASDLNAGAANSVLTAHGGGAEPTWETLDTADALTVYNETGSTITKGTLVNLSGFDGVNGITMTKADADANIPATHVVIADILTLSSGTVEGLKTLDGFDTSLLAVGTPLYLSGTAGGYTDTAPTGSDQIQQLIGVVKTSDAGTGEIVFFPGAAQNLKLGTSYLQDYAVGENQIAGDAVSLGKVSLSISNTLGIQGHNDSGVQWNEGTLLKISGWWDATSSYLMSVADAGAGEIATHVVSAAIPDTGTGVVYPFITVGNIDTSLQVLGDAVYADPTTPGGFTFSAPTGADQLSQQVGSVYLVDVAGYIAFFPGQNLVKKLGTSSLQDDAISNAKIAAGAVTYAEMGAQAETFTLALPCQNDSGGTLTKGTLVRISGLAVGGPNIVAADSALGEIATHVLNADILNTETGVAYPTSVVTGLNTAGFGVGTLVYADPTTPGGYTITEPTGAGELSQQVGIVYLDNAVTGLINFFPGRMIVKKHGTSNLQDVSVTDAKIASLDFETTDLISIADTEILIGTGAGTGAYAAMSGDVTLANTGVATVAAVDLETATLTNIADTELLIGTGAGTANYAAMSGDVSLSNAGVAAVTAIDLETATVTNIADTEIMIGDGAGSAVFAAMSGDATLANTGALTIAALAVETGMIADDAVTAPKMNLVVTADLGAPIVATDDRIVTVVNLVNGVQAIAGYPDTPRNLTVTIVDTTPSITVGTVTVDGFGADGAVISEVFNCAAGAGVYTGAKIFGNITAVTSADFSVLGGGGDETIKVGVGNLIGLPTNISASSAVKLIYVIDPVTGGTIPANVSYTTGTNTSSASPYTGVAGDLFDGTNRVVVNYNVGQ